MRRNIVLLVILFVFPLVVGAQSARSDLLNRINTLRAEVGVHAYSLNAALNVAAQNQAEWMVATGLISHTQSDGSTPRTRAQNAGYNSQWVSENIYMGTNATAQTAFVWWTNSSIHYRGMTAGHYYDIGIGSASGNGQTAYVLVFGNPSTAVRVADPVKVAESDPFNFAGEGSTANGASSNGSSSAPAQRDDPPPPSFVVGLDEWGNILHEVQPGHTMGDILFMYGYNWEDMDWVRTINGMTARESRWLDVGDVVKIPPYQGTYTPAPGTPPWSAPATRTPSPEPSLPTLTPEPASATPQPSPTPTATLDPAITPSPTFTLLPPVEQIYLETTPEPTEALSPTAEPTERPAWVAATITPSPTPIIVAQADPNAGGVIAPRTLEDPPADTSGPPGWLIAVIALQVGVLIGAGIEYWRRGRAG